MDKTSRLKMKKQTVALNNNLEQVNLIDIFRTFLLKAVECILFSSAHGTFSTIDHVVGHQTSLNEFKKIEFIPSILSDHDDVNLEMNYKKKTEKNTNMLRLNYILLSNE